MICPNCKNKFKHYNLQTSIFGKKNGLEFSCPHCQAKLVLGSLSRQGKILYWTVGVFSLGILLFISGVIIYFSDVTAAERLISNFEQHSPWIFFVEIIVFLGVLAAIALIGENREVSIKRDEELK